MKGGGRCESASIFFLLHGNKCVYLKPIKQRIDETDIKYIVGVVGAGHNGCSGYEVGFCSYARFGIAFVDEGEP